MTNLIFQKIIKESQSKVEKLAKRNGWLWFYNMHQKEVIKYAEKLLKIYKKADRRIVLVSCWLHDIAHYYARNSKEVLEVKKDHHINSAKIAEELLREYGLKEKEINKIKTCIIRHRNSKPYEAKTLNEKIVVVADTLSHFGSVFYLTYFKFYPRHSLKRFKEDNLAKLRRDWRDLQLLPKAKKLVETEYRTLKKLLENYED